MYYTEVNYNRTVHIIYNVHTMCILSDLQQNTHNIENIVNIVYTCVQYTYSIVVYTMRAVHQGVYYTDVTHSILQ